MLWVNLVMDTLASLALATEPPTEALLNRKPYGRTKSIISPMMMRNIIGQSLYQLVIMFIILYAGQYFLGVESTVDKIQLDPHAGKELSGQFTLVFNAFVLMTLFNEINSRKLHGERNVFKGIFRNPFFYCIWLSCFGAQVSRRSAQRATLDDDFEHLDSDCYLWRPCVQLRTTEPTAMGMEYTVRYWIALLAASESLARYTTRTCAFVCQVILFIPTEPFGRCFSAMYRICCPCCSKRSAKKLAAAEDRRKSELDVRRVSRKSDGGHIQFSTIGQLTSATVVTEPPPVFAKFMLRKSVDRLNSEVRRLQSSRDV